MTVFKQKWIFCSVGFSLRLEQAKAYSTEKLIGFLFLFVFSACSEKITERKDWDKVFEEYGVKGSFLLYDQKNDSYMAHNYARCEQGFVPASTFKIFNALVGLETEVVKDEKMVIKWDGKIRNTPAWNEDHSLRSAIKVSCVPYFQEVARRVGEENMQKYLIKASYGNQKMGAKLDNFWLEGDLRISVKEQVDFLKRFYDYDLPFSRRNIGIVKKILLVEETENYKLYAKTGWGVEQDKNIGWWVGFIETKNKVYFFATNIEGRHISDSKFQKARIEITQRFLRELKIM